MSTVRVHNPRAPLAMQGGTTFYFVTDGIESALQQTRAAAGDEDIVIGGAERLLDNVAGSGLEHEQIRAVPGTGVAHVKYRVLK